MKKYKISESKLNEFWGWFGKKKPQSLQKVIDNDPELKKHRGLNAAFDFAGVTPVRKQALGLLGEQGRLVIVGIANEPIVIPNDMAFTYMRTQIMGHYGSEEHHVRELIEFTRQGQLDLSQSVSEIMPLEKAGEALDKLANKVDNPIRIVLKP